MPKFIGKITRDDASDLLQDPWIDNKYKGLASNQKILLMIIRMLILIILIKLQKNLLP